MACSIEQAKKNLAGVKSPGRPKGQQNSGKPKHRQGGSRHFPSGDSVCGRFQRLHQWRLGGSGTPVGDVSEILSGRTRSRVALLAAWLLALGCATPPPGDPSDAFRFPEDTFAFANELVSDYVVDADGRLRMVPREVPSEYRQNCVTMARRSNALPGSIHSVGTIGTPEALSDRKYRLSRFHITTSRRLRRWVRRSTRSIQSTKARGRSK